MTVSQFLSTSVASALIRALGLALSLLLNVVMARTLAPAEFGVYALVLAMVAMLGIPAKFGLPIHVARGTAKAMALGDTATVWALWSWAYRLIVLSGGLILLGLVGWLAITARGEPDTWWLWFCGGMLVPILALAHLRSASMSGLGYPVLSQIQETVMRPLLIVTLALAFSATLEADFSALQAVILNVIGSGFVFVLGIGLLIWLAPRRPPRNTWPNDRAMKRAWFTSTLTLGLAVGAQTLGGNMDVIMLGFLQSEVEVGVYKVALNAGSLVGFGLQSINMVLLPRLAGLHHKGAVDEVRNLVRTAARLALAATIAICLFLVFYGKWLVVALFGAEYGDVYVTLLIIGAGQLIGAMFGSVMLVVNMTGNEKAALRGTIGFALLNVMLNATLIPFAGKEGAAIATAVSLAALNIYLWYAAWTRAGINTFAIGPLQPPLGKTKK